MKVKYFEINLEGKGRSQIIFLKNKNLWFFISPKTKSRFFGGFIFCNNQALRFLDDIYFNDEIIEINILSPNEVILYFKNNQAYLNLQPDGLNINFSSWQNIKLTFDIKDVFKNEPFKRNIKIEKIYSCFCVIEEFLEGSGLVKFSIETDSPLILNSNWQEKIMDFDQKRNSPPYSWWVYDGIEGKIRELKIKIIVPDHRLTQIDTQIFTDNIINFLLSRIDSLILDNYLPAGFTWFYENWFRDELLSLYLLKLTQNYGELTHNHTELTPINTDYYQQDLSPMTIILKNFFEQRMRFYLYNLEKIWDKNKIQSTLNSADTLLLLIINLPQDLLLAHLPLVEKYFFLWQQKFNLDNLPPSSTWMDTLERKSALEIDCLYLKTLRRLARINKNYIDLANKTKERIIKKIKSNPVDVNLIFAYLFLEDIFSRNDWQKFFEKLIEASYLDWGGLSTLPKNHPNFKNEDDGEIAMAYHWGDSWYYLNNLLSFCLNKINYRYFKDNIRQIIKSSLEDLFFDGALGWPSEISSAKERKSEGSLVQLWSIASLILLARSFQNFNIFLES
ncbi:MAG: hypothetical protein KatS3mg096_320 [Candidatus Parcubacteria bacterium]|nr:MAG: hypothetical protein KatS3mg096_320 [Candidatus Parcubacteria bacterium]